MTHEGYCVKCKKKQKISDAKAVEVKKGRWAVTGKCPTCGTKMYRIVGKEKPTV
ncbi:MAG: DUF5679 domain-containing protein [Candidatus Pacearchaeota archaeon]